MPSMFITGTSSDTTHCYITYSCSGDTYNVDISSSPNDASFFSSATISSCILSGCTPGTTYNFTFWPKDSSGVRYSPAFASVTTLGGVPGGTSGISASAVSQRNPKLMNVFWNSVPNATGYRLYKSSDGGSNYIPVVGSDGQVGNVTSYQVTVDYEWQYYRFQVTATNSYGNGPNVYSSYPGVKSNDSYSPVINTFYVTGQTSTSISVYAQGADTPPDAGSMSGVAGGSMSRNGSLVAQPGANGSGEVFYTFTGLSPGTTYSLSCALYDAASNFSGTMTVPGTTSLAPDSTPPYVGHTFTNRSYSIEAAWSISDITGPPNDIETGFEHAVLFMSGQGGGTRFAVVTTYAYQSSIVLTTDGTGAAIVPNKNYYFHWEAYDYAGNKNTTSAVLVFTEIVRPSNFEWTYPKTGGADFKITANEWNLFQNQINAFRGYKNLTPYSFTQAFAGFNFTANHYNEARNAIFGMNGSIPPFRNPGESVFASEINALRDALNAVT